MLIHCVGGPLNGKQMNLPVGSLSMNVPILERGGFGQLVYDLRTFQRSGHWFEALVHDDLVYGDLIARRIPPWPCACCEHDEILNHDVDK